MSTKLNHPAIIRNHENVKTYDFLDYIHKLGLTINLRPTADGSGFLASINGCHQVYPRNNDGPLMVYKNNFKNRGKTEIEAINNLARLCSGEHWCLSYSRSLFSFDDKITGKSGVFPVFQQIPETKIATSSKSIKSKPIRVKTSKPPTKRKKRKSNDIDDYAPAACFPTSSFNGDGNPLTPW